MLRGRVLLCLGIRVWVCRNIALGARGFDLEIDLESGIRFY
jgi:hypothetical protein